MTLNRAKYASEVDPTTPGGALRQWLHAIGCVGEAAHRATAPTVPRAAGGEHADGSGGGRAHQSTGCTTVDAALPALNGTQHRVRQGRPDHCAAGRLDHVPIVRDETLGAANGGAATVPRRRKEVACFPEFFRRPRTDTWAWEGGRLGSYDVRCPAHELRAGILRIPK